MAQLPHPTKYAITAIDDSNRFKPGGGDIPRHANGAKLITTQVEITLAAAFAHAAALAYSGSTDEAHARNAAQACKDITLVALPTIALLLPAALGLEAHSLTGDTSPAYSEAGVSTAKTLANFKTAIDAAIVDLEAAVAAIVAARASLA